LPYEYFLEIIANASDENGERFQQDIFQTENWYRGKWRTNVLLNVNGGVRETRIG
jgi:hypothetical protein